jgi:hypothetical protein
MALNLQTKYDLSLPLLCVNPAQKSTTGHRGGSPRTPCGGLQYLTMQSKEFECKSGNPFVQMNQMMQMPGIQEMMQSPEVEQLTSSPALAQMMGSLFNGQQGEGRAAGETQQAAGGGPQGQGVPDLTSLFQTMMPLAQQVTTLRFLHPLNPPPHCISAATPTQF